MKSPQYLNLKVGKDVIAINLVSIVLVLAIILAPESPLRIILGIPFILFFPGYALTSMLFPSKQELGELERFTLSLASSLCLVPLLGLALNYAPWGITLTPIVTVLYLLTLLFSIASQYRRFKLPTEKRFSSAFKLPSWSKMSKIDRVFITGVLAAGLIVGGFGVYMATGPKTGERFTEFYVLGSNGTLTDYPVNLTLGESGLVILGITNHELKSEKYTITISQDNQTIETIDNVELEDQHSWQQNFTYTPNVVGQKICLEFQLFKASSLEACQRLQLFINVREQS